MKCAVLKLALLLTLVPCALYAGDAPDPATPQASASADPFVKFEDQIKALGERGVLFQFTYTGEVFANLAGGDRRGAIYEGLVKTGIQFDLEKITGWEGATILVNALYPHGQSLTDRYVHDFNTLSNIDAYNSIRLYEAWFQQNLADGKFSIRAGQILADSEFFVSNGGSLFINSAFGAIPLVSKNLNVEVYPVAAPGVRVRYAPNESFYAQFGAFTGDAGDIRTNNRHGVLFDVGGENGAFLIGEIGWTLNPPPKTSPSDVKNKDAKEQVITARPLSGTYKLGGFYHTGAFDDLRGNGTHRGDCAFYVIADQDLWHKPGAPEQGLKLFGRIGAAPSDRNTVSFYFDTGLNYIGLLPSRDKDVFGIGVSCTKISDDLLDESGAPVSSHHETILEATYQIAVNDWLSVQPDFQYILNPGATGAQQNAVVTGLRFTINF